MRQIYLDLDGVLADFDGHFYNIFGVNNKDIPDTKMWEYISSEEDFFFNLPLLPDALKLFDYAKQYNPIILTACQKSNYVHTAKQKKAWVRYHLSEDIQVLPMLGGKNKFLFMRKLGDILIDDFKPNVYNWIDNGGVGILHKSIDDSINKLSRYV